MTKYIISFAILIYSNTYIYGQIKNITNNITNSTLPFLMHKDSIQNLYEINHGIVVINKDTINLKDSIYLYFETSEFNKSNIKTYLIHSENIKNGLYTTLDFYNNRLFQINMFSNKSYYLNNIKLEIDRCFKNNNTTFFKYTADSAGISRGRMIEYGRRYSEQTSFGSTKRIKFHYKEDLIKGVGFLILEDKKTSKLMPASFENQNNDEKWLKLNKYIMKNAL